ncbi:extracellular solute-binding protein [Paenibacillus sp. IB182496]|uniref:Extracellular solute-binding protein n=1 Tax=Paenibacillus sabuli TaxID=2772509 RepID=A0A927BQE4_9BACL|nr:extracellular solute-binding protein [Paenibacillus sabuli]MBD2843845.1 extracellular solute-binding protein [Paenibacillus sabuli]
MSKRTRWHCAGALGMAALLLAAGCGNGNNGGNDGNGNTGGATGGDGGQVGAGSVPTFEVMFDYNVDPEGMSLTDNEYIDYLEEQTGVRVEVNSPGSAGYMDKLNILMASGEYPDGFMVTEANRAKLLQFAGDGLLTDLAPYLDDYPNLSEVMPEEAWLPVTQEGKVWALPYNRHDGFNQVVYINKTWLDALGLDIPRTVDEFYAVMKAFTDKDPDGNGKDDTFGLLANSDLSYGGRMFQAAFGAEGYTYEGGELLPAEITPAYQQYLAFMNRLTAEGILDPEFPTTTGTIFRQKINTLKYGMFNGFWHFQSGKEFSPGVFDHFIAIAPPLRPDGSETVFTYNSTNRHYIAIPESTDNVEALLSFYDWAVSEEGTKYNFMGIEGVHWQETADGGYEKIGERNALHWAFSMIKHGLYTDEVKAYMKTEFGDDVIDNLTLASDTGTLDKIAASLPYYPELAAYNLPKIVEEYRAKAILGNANVEADFDAFVAKYRASGGDKAIGLWTDWYEANKASLQD